MSGIGGSIGGLDRGSSAIGSRIGFVSGSIRSGRAIFSGWNTSSTVSSGSRVSDTVDRARRRSAETRRRRDLVPHRVPTFRLATGRDAEREFLRLRLDGSGLPRRKMSRPAFWRCSTCSQLFAWQSSDAIQCACEHEMFAPPICAAELRIYRPMASVGLQAEMTAAVALALCSTSTVCAVTPQILRHSAQCRRWSFRSWPTSTAGTRSR